MKKLSIVLFFVSFLFANSFAQPYVTALGVRLFGTNGTGLTLQQRLSEGFAFEGIGQLKKESYTVSALFKSHNKILFSRHWNYYFGLGGHYGGYLQELSADRKVIDHYYGANGMIGTELTIGRFSIAFDYMPSFSIVRPESEDFVKHDIGLSLRLVLIKPKKQKGFFEGLEKLFKDTEDTPEKKKKTKEM